MSKHFVSIQANSIGLWKRLASTKFSARMRILEQTKHGGGGSSWSVIVVAWFRQSGHVAEVQCESFDQGRGRLKSDRAPDPFIGSILAPE